MCSDIGVEPSLPRQCNHKIYRSNLPADTPSAYYCHSVSIPLLDYLLSEMESGFSTHQQNALLGLSLIPSIMASLSLEECTTKVSQLAEMYEEDLPSPECIEGELHCWWMKWQQELTEHGHVTLSSTPTQALCHATTMFPNIWALASILCTFPVTNCLAERSFSAVKRMKTVLRSSMGTHRLNGLALLHIHCDISVYISDAIDEFAHRHPRRLQMANILVD